MDALGDRMKTYERVTQLNLPRRTYTIIRVDGRAFHTLLRKAEKPFDYEFASAMEYVSTSLCREISGAQFAYTQSDEVSVLVTDFDTIQTQSWFGGNLQKFVSISASIATKAFVWRGQGAMFDSRAFTIPDRTEVMNYFLWRQKDAVRNSINMVAQHHFSHKSLQGLNSDQLQEKLWQEAGVNWSDLHPSQKRGTVVKKANRVWQPVPAGHFKADGTGELEELVPKLGG